MTREKNDPDVQQEGSFETGTDEFFKAHSQLMAANTKRTYDAYQDLDLLRARDAQTETLRNSTIATQALQNAVETANMVAKQAVRHSDIAIDREWNVDEQGYTVADILNDSKFQDAIATAMTKVVADMAATKK